MTPKGLIENSRTGQMAVTADDEALYLYCLIRSDNPKQIEGIGVDGHGALFLHPIKNIAAVLSRVRLVEFCGDAAESRLKDLAWLGPRACRHEEVVEEAMVHSPVLPIRFGTIFSSLENLEAHLRTHFDAITEFMDRVSDQEEWAVKAFLDRKKTREVFLSTALAQTTEGRDALSPGKRYFEEQRLRRDVEKEVQGWLKQNSQKMADDLTRHASDFRQRKVLSRKVSGTEAEMILNWAFLIPQDRLADFETRISQANAEYADRGLEFHLSGPWPPYSFGPFLDPAGIAGRE